MIREVTDRVSNVEEQIERAAKTIGRSKARLAVFRAIYTGKQKGKSVADLSATTKLSNVRVLQEGKKLVVAGFADQYRGPRGTEYVKVEFVQHNRDKILRYATNPRLLDKIATKRRPAIRVVVPAFRFASSPKFQAKFVSVDEIASFRKIRKHKSSSNGRALSETSFKRGIVRILGDTKVPKDWGGESGDILSSRLKLAGKRRLAAFALKGPGTSGKLTPGKMGKNGDQIQRLVLRCPAEVFVVQYWGSIDEAVTQQLKSLADLKSFQERRSLWYCVIDGEDSRRLIEAYPKEFRTGRRN